ncbi:MAG TPA: hypothetical protein VFZ61_28195 [Polyangiales bacterium]
MSAYRQRVWRGLVTLTMWPLVATTALAEGQGPLRLHAAPPPAGEATNQTRETPARDAASGPVPVLDIRPAAAEAEESDASDQAIERAYRSLELRLERKADGSFVYTGRGIGARIDAQGGLTMWDKFSSARFAMDPQKIDDYTWVVRLFRVFFDLYARLDKAFGNDPYRSERRDFLEQTRDLQTLLLERNAERALERMLDGIWKLAQMSISEKKQRLFSLWTECSSDRYGQKARRRIEEFVREHCGRESACEYSEAEIERLSARLGAGARFSPYEPQGEQLGQDAGRHEE